MEDIKPEPFPEAAILPLVLDGIDEAKRHSSAALAAALGLAPGPAAADDYGKEIPEPKP